MANPVPYQQLFDIDGLNKAIADCQIQADNFSVAVTNDFKRIGNSIDKIKDSIKALNETMGSRTIKLVDETSQQAIVDYAKQVIDLTKQVRDQQKAISNLTEVINANKIAVSDAKVKAAEYGAEQEKLKAQQEATKLSIVQATLALAQNKNAVAASNTANQQYITTVKQNQAAQSGLNTQIAQNRLSISALSLANKQAAQAQTTANGSYNEATARLKALGNQIKSLPGEFQQSTAAGKALVAQYNQLNDGLKKFDASMGNHQRNVGNYKSGLSGLVVELGSLVTGYLSISGALELVTKTFNMKLVTDANRTALEYILGSTELANVKITMLKDTAEQTGLEFTALSHAYNTFTGAAKASNFSLSDSDRIFRSVAHAAGIMHLSSDETTSALRALSRMMETGTVQAKYMQNELGIYIPQATSAMADALGIPIEKLHEMEKTGGILSAKVLPKFAESLDKIVAPGVKRISSLQAAWNRLTNVFSTSVDENTGLGKFFTYFITKTEILARSLLNITNSTSWKEFFLRGVNYLSGAQLLGINAFANAADMLHNADKNKTTEAVEQFAGSDRKQQLEFLRVQTAIRDEAYRKAESGNRKDIAYYNDMQKLLIKLRDIYASLYTEKKKYTEIPDEDLNSITGIRQRITELSKEPGSATKGSPIKLRIEALRKRLHDLQPDLKAAKDGFAILEDAISKMGKKLEDAIVYDERNGGKMRESTKLLASEWVNASNKLIKYRKDLEDLKNQVARDAMIKQFGSVFPLQPHSFDKNNPLSAKEQGQLSISDNLSTISDKEQDLNGVVAKYAAANAKILQDYAKRNHNKEQMDQALLVSEMFQASEEHKLNDNIIDLKLKNEEIANGKSSKMYSDLLAQKAKLDEGYVTKVTAFTEKQLQEQIKKITDAFDAAQEALRQNASLVGEATSNPGAGKLSGDIGDTLVDFAKKSALQAQGLGPGISSGDETTAAAKIGMDAIQTYTDFAINASKQRQAQLEQEMSWEIQGAGTNSLAKQKIEREYTQKIKVERQKQAELNKAAAAVEIILNTAIAVTKVAAQTGVGAAFLVPAIIALGAIELGIVLATPVPQFAGGRDGGPATVAEVNERGPEALVKDGKVRFANKGKRGYTFLQKDEKVLRADETKAMIDNQIYNADQVSRSKQTYDTWVSTQSNSRDIDYDKMAVAMSDAVGKLPLEENVWNERGHAHYRRVQNTRIKSVRDKHRL